MSLMHLKMEFFHLTMDFKNKSQICLTKHCQIVKSKKKIDTIKNSIQNANRDNLQVTPQRSSPIN